MSDDVEKTLPFNAIVSLPGQDETVETPTRPTGTSEDPSTVAEGQFGTLPYGSVLAPPGEVDPMLAETQASPPPGPAPAANQAAGGFGSSPVGASSQGSGPAGFGSSPQPSAPGGFGSSPGAAAPTALAGAAPSDFGPGVTLEGGFELERVLDRDRLGEWWSALHPTHGPCRVLALGKSQAATQGPRLLIGARVAMDVPPDARLELPVATGGQPRPWIASQRLQAPSLAEALAGAAPPVLRWARDLAGGLQALHAYGVAHGEPSPENARVPAASGAARWTRIGLTLEAGPPEARAPELEGGSAPTREGDVYAFGALLRTLAKAASERSSRKGLEHLGRRCQSEPRPTMPEVLAGLRALEEGGSLPRPPWVWLLAGFLAGLVVGALGTFAALG